MTQCTLVIAGVGLVRVRISTPSPTAAIPSPSRLRFYTPVAAQGAFNLQRLARGGAKTPMRHGAMPSPLLALPSPGSPSPGAKLGAELLLEFARQGDDDTSTPESCPAVAGPALLLLEGPAPESASPARYINCSPADAEAAATGARQTPLRAAMAAVKTPLRSALKRKKSPSAGTPHGPVLPTAGTANKSTGKRVRFLEARRSRASSGSDERRGGSTISSRQASPSVFMTPGRRIIDDCSSPIRGGSASTSMRVPTSRGC